MEATAGPVSPHLKKVTWIVYILQAAGIFFVLADVVGVILNIVYNDDARSDTVIAAHFRWQLRTFWYSLAWVLLGLLLFITVLGAPLAFLVWGGVWVWYIYRVIRGMLMFSEHRTPKNDH